MKRLSFVAFAISAVILTFAACGEKKFRGFTKTKTGLYYKITTKNAEGKVPQEGDILYLEVSVESDFDSLYTFPPQKDVQRLEPSKFNGDINEAYSLLKEGEEGEFYIQADSFFLYFTMMEMPSTVKPEDKLLFKIKLERVQTMEEYEREYEEMLEAKKEEEKTLLATYIAEQKITVPPTESGLYYIETLKGKGVKAENGKQVTIHWVGKLLDGMVFNSTIVREKPTTFILGDENIPLGITEGLLLMKEGGKATLITPSALAFGEGGGGFPPFTTIVFDIELVKVEKAPEIKLVD